jgi:hypothetical protein
LNVPQRSIFANFLINSERRQHDAEEKEESDKEAQGHKEKETRKEEKKVNSRQAINETAAEISSAAAPVKRDGGKSDTERRMSCHGDIRCSF